MSSLNMDVGRFYTLYKMFIKNSW